MPILSNFPSGSGSGGGGLALNAVTNITTQAASGKVYVKWTDPEDIILDDTALATWGGTLLVRKAGSMPVSRRDGVIVLDTAIKNQYSESYFCDSGLTDGETYYYKFFPYTTTKTYTDSTDNEFTATPTVQVSGIEDWVVTGMSASSEAGDGKMAVKWTDPAETITSDGVTLATWGSTTVVIKAGSYPTSKNDTDAVYIMKSTTRNQYASSALTVTGLNNGTTYYIAFFPETSDGGINTAASQRVTGKANRITISASPIQSGTLTYTGNTLSPIWSNYNSEQMTLGGVTTGINAGSYDATFTPTTDYRWNDGTVTTKTASWTIAKAAGSLSLSASNVTLDADTLSATVTVTRAGDGEITAVSDNTDVVAISVSGTTLTISSVNEMSGTANITVSVEEGTNYTASASQTIAVSAEFLPAIGAALNDYSWEEIDQIAAAGVASNYWSIGDRKAVSVSGTVGTLSVSGIYYVYIIGFDHNGETNTIDFGTFKTALSGGKDVCLIDENYSSVRHSGSKWFNMNHYGALGDYGLNYGGWKGCDARYDILGSTNTAPSGYGSRPTTSKTGYNAGATTATSPVSNTLMAALPSDLRAVMKPMTIYTDNTGDGTNTAACVTASVDYLPLLAVYEVTGSTTYANSSEKNYQAQYTYYANGNSTVKHKHNATSTEAKWWSRSPAKDYAFYWCYFTTSDGHQSTNDVGNSFGFAPIFRV